VSEVIEASVVTSAEQGESETRKPLLTPLREYKANNNGALFSFFLFVDRMLALHAPLQYMALQRFYF